MNELKPDCLSSILIVLMGALGDVVRAFCLLDPIKRKYPGCRISWLVEPKCSALVAAHPIVDKVFVYKRNTGIGSIVRTCRQLSAEHFDVTLDLQRHVKSGFFSYMSGAPRRIGFNRHNSKEFNWVFNNEHIEYFSDTLPKLMHYLKFIEYLGIEVDDKLEFGLDRLKFEDVSPELSAGIKQPFLALVMGSSWESKNWLSEGYRNLCRALLTEAEYKEYRLVLLGDRAQAGAAAALEVELNSDRLVNLVNKTSLIELCAVIKEAKLCIGPDSGPGHIAGAAGVPYIGLYGPTSPQRVAFYGSEHLAVHSSIGCSPCYRRRCPGLNKLCMRLISVEAVLEKVSRCQ